MVALRGPPAPTVNPEGIGLQAEEAYELRLERIMVASGPKAVVAHLKQEAAKNERPWAAAWLGHYQLYGDVLGVPEVHDEKAGLLLAQQAMRQGSLFAKEVVGRAMADGRGQPRAVFEGVVLLKEAAEAGRYTAMSQLATQYYYGAGVPQDIAQAEVYAQRAAYRGDSGALWHLGEWSEAGKAGRKPDSTKAG